MPSALPTHDGNMSNSAPRLDPAPPVSARTTASTPAKKPRDPALCPTDEEATVPQHKAKNKKSWDYIWRSAVAGGLAGCAAKTFVAPLDRVKILFQASNPEFARYQSSWLGTGMALRDIYTHEGVLGLWKGHSATLLRIFPYAGIKFLAYEQIRHIVIPRKEYETPFRRLISGSMAGVTSVFCTYPLEVVRVRLAFETKHRNPSSFTTICRQIYFENAPVSYKAPSGRSVTVDAAAATVVNRPSGIGNFYRGFSSTLLGMLPYAGMSFLTHDTMGDIFRLPSIAKYTTLHKPENYPVDKPPPLRSWAELASGGIAGLVSQTVSYPLEVVRRRMQVGGAVGDGRRLRIKETAATIFRERGISGFFVGLTIGYVKVVPMVAISFYTYERFKLWLGI